MLAAKMVAPIVRLVFIHKRFVADGATGRDLLFVAGWMARFCCVHIEAIFGYGLVAEGAAKVFGVPVRVERAEIVAENRLGAAFTDPCDCHKLCLIRLWLHNILTSSTRSNQYSCKKCTFLALVSIACVDIHSLPQRARSPQRNAKSKCVSLRQNSRRYPYIVFTL